MDEQKKINYLVTGLSFAFIIICIFTYLLTDNKSEWYFKLLNNLVPELLGPLIAILFIFYAFTARGINIFEPDKLGNFSQYKSSFEETPVDSFGIELRSHVNNAKVERVNLFYGTYKNLPENIRLRIYLANEHQSLCWINSKNVIVNSIDKTWQSTVYVGAENESGYVFHVIVAIENAVTDQWLDYYEQISAQLNHWKPFKYPLPKAIVETNKIKVIRI
jgi:hypothetical protein